MQPPSYRKIDRQLNRQYSLLINDSDFRYHKLLIDGQRSWIRYRDLKCGEVFNAINPGEEAGIEKIGCLSSLTSSRFLELVYIESGISNDVFYNLLSVLGGGLSKARSELLQYIDNVSGPFEGSEYAKQNCKLTNAAYGEDLKFCEVRIKYKDM